MTTVCCKTTFYSHCLLPRILQALDTQAFNQRTKYRGQAAVLEEPHVY